MNDYEYGICGMILVVSVSVGLQLIECGRNWTPQEILELIHFRLSSVRTMESIPLVALEST